jgi:hypothetical protein
MKRNLKLSDVNKSNFRNIYRNKLAELKINDFRPTVRANTENTILHTNQSFF